MFNLTDSEFSFDAEVSKLACCLNGAFFHLVQTVECPSIMIKMSALNTVLDTVMLRDRGISNLSTARYVLSSLVVIILRLRGEKGNVDGWKPSDSDKDTGVRGHGSCCP